MRISLSKAALVDSETFQLSAVGRHIEIIILTTLVTEQRIRECFLFASLQSPTVDKQPER